jgi:HEAT repeat protein
MEHARPRRGFDARAPSVKRQEVSMLSHLLCFLFAAPPGDGRDPEVVTLVAQLGGCVEMDCAALRALVAKGEKVWPSLEVGLDHGDEMVRFWSLGVLSEVPVAAARPRLVALLGDPLVRIRAAAAFALGAQRSPEVVAPLIQALTDADVNVRFEAATALGRVPDPRSLEPLVTASQDGDEDVRRAACESLGALNDDRARPALVERLNNDKKAIVRGHAAIGLGMMKAAAALDALIKRSERERDAEALGAVVWALGEIGDAKARPALAKLAGHASAVVKREAASALAKLAPGPAE